MSRPKTLVVEYEDSTRREIPFSTLGEQVQFELAALGLCEAPGPEAAKAYLLLQWKDGWKEVVAVDERATELLRYYSIERVEELGRLSLEMEGAAPELLIIKRLPGAVQGALLIANDQVQAYAFEEKVTVKEGGKVEHVFYDKKRPVFSKQEPAAASALYAGVLDAIQEQLDGKGLSATAILAMSGDERVAMYQQLCSVLGLRAAERQQDVYGFIEAALKTLGTENKARAAANN